MLITLLRIPDVLATLGMMFLLAGLQLIPSAGRSITTGLNLPDGSVARGSFDPAFLAIGRHRLWNVVPLPVVIVALLALQGRQDAAQQREQIEQAISLGVQGIIVSQGQPEAVKDVIQKALDAGIEVVVKDIDIGNPDVPLISQSDHDIARQVLDQALKDNGPTFDAGYAFVAGFRPLELRGEVRADVKKANPGIAEKALWGAVDTNTATTVASQTAAALRANPDISVVFAPYDEFARGVKLGATEAGLADKIRIYSADVSTSDILEIRENGSPWVATSATNPAVVGEVSLRALALLIAGQDPGRPIEVKPFLITQDDLDKNDIRTIQDLDAKLPGFGHSDQATASWLPSTQTQ